MRRVLLFLYLATICHTTIFATEPVGNHAERDSLLAIYHSMAKDTLRIINLQKGINNRLGEDWSIEIIDTLLKESKELNFAAGELHALFTRCNYFSYHSDTLNMRINFEELARASERHKIYNRYFSMWRVLGEYKSKRGETEAVMLEADRMKAKAIELNDKNGLYYAALMKAEALGVAKRNDDALEIYREILTNKEIDKYKRSEIHWRVYTILYDKREHLAAITEIEESIKLYHEHYAETKKGKVNPHMLLQKELGYCRIYTALPDIEKLHDHLKRAENYYTPTTHPSLRASYFLHWALYYHFVAEWEKCYTMFDRTFAELDGTMPLFTLSLYQLKAEVLQRAGQYKESAESYLDAAKINDSLNQEILRLHEEVLQANYTINQGLIDKSNLEYKQSVLKTVLSSLVGLLLIAILGRRIHTNHRLKQAKNETKRLLQIAKNTNKKKEEFLHNITHKIRIPLNTIVGFSDYLTQERVIDEEEAKIISKTIKEDAEYLSLLIFNVLHLSRLESGMMRLTIQEHNIVQLCKDAIWMVEAKTGVKILPSFTTSEEEFIAETDSEQLLKIIASLLEEGIKSNALEMKTKLVVNDQKAFEFTIYMSPLSQITKEEQVLQHAINKAFCDLFKGAYTVVEHANERIVQLTLPSNHSIENKEI